MAKNTKVRVEFVLLDKFKSAGRNPKEHNDEGIEASFKRFGFKDFPTINEATGELVEGHGRVATLRRMHAAAQKAPDGILVRGKQWSVPTIRGLRFKTRQLAEEYVVAHNQLTISAGFDSTLLSQMVNSWQGLDASSLGFSDEALARLLATEPLRVGGLLGDDAGGQAGNTPGMVVSTNALMKMVPLYLNEVQAVQFNEWVTALGKRYDKSTVTDVVYAAMERSFKAKR